MATNKACEQNRIVGTHVALIAFSLIGQRLLQLAFLSIFSGPLKLTLNVCVVTMAIWFVHQFAGSCPRASSAVGYVNNILWESTERDNVPTTLRTHSSKARGSYVGNYSSFNLSTRFLKSTSIASSLFTGPALPFTPLTVFVKIFKFVGLLGKFTRTIPLALAVLLFIFVVEMAWPSWVRPMTYCFKKHYNGFSINGIFDRLWKENKTFIDLRPERK